MLKKLPIIWDSFARNFVAKNFQKSPNLVTLFEALHEFAQLTMCQIGKKLGNEDLLISKLKFVHLDNFDVILRVLIASKKGLEVLSFWPSVTRCLFQFSMIKCPLGKLKI